MSSQLVVNRRQAGMIAFSAIAAAPAFVRGSTPCAPACATPGVRPQDSIWAISTRHLGCGHAFSPQVWRLQEGRWQPSTLAAFYATDSSAVVTSAYIHGNRIEPGQALADGLSFYTQLIGRSTDERPNRFVIWSWPSSQIKGVRKDVLTKAARTNVEGYFLAEFLAGMRADVQVGLLGYSFGARIITGGMHLLGGGNLLGRVVSSGNRRPTNVVLWAAALHNYWLLPGRFYGCALPMAQDWLIYVNGCDPVLKHYHRIEKCGDPAALGYTGLAGLNTLPADLRSRIEQWQVSHLIGGTHDVRPYVYSPVVGGRTRQYLMWQELTAKKAADNSADSGTPSKPEPAAVSA